MALPKHDITSYTEEEYLAFDLDSDTRNEYADGQIFAMAGASREHNVVAHNVSRNIGNQIEAKNLDCDLYQSDMRVNVRKKGAYRYPDLVIVCGKREFADTTPPTLINPTVLIEVLSESTEDKDYKQKLREYRQIASLKEYILISADRPQLERYLRQDDINWLYTALDGMDNSIELPSIACTLTFSDIYRRIDFEDESV